MKTKNLILLLISVLIISCGNPMNPPKNDNEKGKVIITEANETYTVRMGTIVTNIKPSEMTNAWKNYIGGKKVLKPDKTDAGWYFEKETGDYHEPKTFHATNPRAELVGADKNKKPDSSTVWTHYTFPVDPLGRLTEY